MSSEEHCRILLHLVLSLEWTGRAGDQDGRQCRACPACGGIDPTDPVSRGFVREAYGHRPTCRLDFVLRRVVVVGKAND